MSGARQRFATGVENFGGDRRRTARARELRARLRQRFRIRRGARRSPTADALRSVRCSPDARRPARPWRRSPSRCGSWSAPKECARCCAGRRWRSAIPPAVRRVRRAAVACDDIGGPTVLVRASLPESVLLTTRRIVGSIVKPHEFPAFISQCVRSCARVLARRARCLRRHLRDLGHDVSRDRSRDPDDPAVHQRRGALSHRGRAHVCVAALRSPRPLAGVESRAPAALCGVLLSASATVS